MKPKATKFEKNIFNRALFLATAFHLTVIMFVLWPGVANPSYRVLGAMEFELYDPLGGEPGGGSDEMPLAEALPPDPEPIVTPEPEPVIDELPQIVESTSEKAEIAPPPPVETKITKKEKPKPKPQSKREVPVVKAGDGSQASPGDQPGFGQGDSGGGTSKGNPDALAAYKTKVKRKLERYKKYPPSARNSRIEGITMVSFTLNREGQVVAFNLVKGSGHAVLDDEASALLRRVSPFPSFPIELTENTLTLTAPIQFALR